MKKVWFMYIWGVLGKKGGGGGRGESHKAPEGVGWSLEIVLTWIKVYPGD